MLELWILAGVVVWLVVMTFVIALCVASARADRRYSVARREPRIVRPRPARTRPARRLTRAWPV